MATPETQESVGVFSPTPDRYSPVGSNASRARRWLGIGAMILFVVLVLSPNAATRIYLWPWSLLTSLLVLTPIAFLLGSKSATRATPDLNTTIGLLLLGAVFVISALGSAYVTQSLEACLIPLGSIAAVFLVVQVLNSDPSDSTVRRINLQQMVGTFGILFAGVSLAGWSIGTLLPRWERYSALNELIGHTAFPFSPLQIRNDFPMGHANYTAGLALILLPWQAGLAFQNDGRRRRLWMGATLLTAFVLYTAGSRGALLGVAGIAATGLLVVGLKGRIRVSQLMIGLSTVIIASGIFALATPRIRSLAADFAADGSLNSGDVQRWSMVEAGLRMGWESPMLGQGPGVTPLTYPDFRSGLDGGVDSALQLHSTPIQIWADLGLVGSILALLLIGLTLSHALRSLTAPSSDSRQPSTLVVNSAVVSIAGYLAFALTDFQFDVPIFAGLFAINLGVILADRIENQPAATSRLRIPSRFIRFFGLFLMVPVIWTTFHAQMGRANYSSAINQLERHNIPAFLRGVSSAEAWSPGNAFYPTSAGAGLLHVSYGEADPAQRAELEALAVEAFRRSLRVSENQEIAHFNLGWLLLDTDPESAASHFIRASELVPDKGGVYLGLGLAHNECGDLNRTVDAMALEMVNDPVFITAPLWDIPIFSDLRTGVATQAKRILQKLAESPETAPGVREQCLRTAGLIHDYVHELPGVPMDRTGMDLVGNLPINAAQRSEAIEAYLVTRYGRTADPYRVAAYTGLLDPSRFDAVSFPWHPTGNEWPLIRLQRRERPGYGILMRNLDGPTPTDAYLVQRNGIIEDFYSRAFPSKGHLPTTVMVRAVKLTENDRS